MYWRSGRPLRWCVLAAVLAGLVACSVEPASPEDEIRHLIDALEQAAETGSVSEVAEGLHASYADRWHPNKVAAMRTLVGLLRRHSHVHLFSIVKSIQFPTEQDQARAVVYLAMSGVPVDSVEVLLALKADLFRFDIELLSSEGVWQVTSARWQRANPAELMQ